MRQKVVAEASAPRPTGGSSRGAPFNNSLACNHTTTTGQLSFWLSTSTGCFALLWPAIPPTFHHHVHTYHRAARLYPRWTHPFKGHGISIDLYKTTYTITTGAGRWLSISIIVASTLARPTTFCVCAPRLASCGCTRNRATCPWLLLVIIFMNKGTGGSRALQLTR